ncbi:Hypp8906 [Branchiostoma lanceolatum]|uniref:Hypp8906 protein n=1 Tax=Branchiostoma lanceolatum TaxID=7740 RepID=A0A8K0EJM7_BRALA|nr:Hypp8906 [Branchiostoma lanceolatum]
MSEGESHRKAADVSTNIFLSSEGQLTGTPQLDHESPSPKGSLQLTHPSYVSRAGATALLTVAIAVPLLGFLLFICRCSGRHGRCLLRMREDESQDAEWVTKGVDNLTPEIVITIPSAFETSHVTEKTDTDGSAIFPACPARLHRTVSAPDLREGDHVTGLLPPSWRSNSTGHSDRLGSSDLSVRATMEQLSKSWHTPPMSAVTSTEECRSRLSFLDDE